MKYSSLAAAAVAAALLTMVDQVSADTLAAWQYSSTQSPPVNTLPPTGGVLMASASAEQLGMTNNYAYAAGEGPGSLASCDINIPAPPNNATQVGWRIRGNGNSANSGSGVANGWNSAAPEYSQGAEFDSSTAGYQNISVTFDWEPTNKGCRDLQVMYNLNISNSAGWTPLPGAFVLCGTSGGDWTFGSNFSFPASANNDPNFGVRLVSAYDASNGFTAYADTTGSPLNNSSGNWGFNNISISGTAVPEPSTIALLTGATGVGLLRWSRRRRYRFLRLKT